MVWEEDGGKISRAHCGDKVPSLDAMMLRGGLHSEPQTSSLRQVFPRLGLQETPPLGAAKSATKQQPIIHSRSHLHLPLPFPPLLTPSQPSPFHHPLHSSPTPPPLHSISPSVLSWATIGLLFMASPIEDALLYKTLEPSSRHTPFEDVAHNSYLGL